MVPRSSNATPAPISAIHRVYITIAPDRSRLRQVGHAYARSTVIVSGRLTAAWELECSSTIAQELDWSGTTAQELDWPSTTAQELDWPSTNAWELD
ncbi:hypothetical protein BHE74_00021426 [Ensete ventricosum]|nr:hypothetical protein BHE74_00021426 [Ensete ventricosum]